MRYSANEVMRFVREENVKFIHLAFCDVFGKQKSISIMPEELPNAFRLGISFDGSAIAGLGDKAYPDLFLHPDPSTFVVLPCRLENGKEVRMLSAIRFSDGRGFPWDTRLLLAKTIEDGMQSAGLRFSFGTEQEFYLFTLDESGRPTRTPYDQAGYMDIAPDDRGENIRREICLALKQMGIQPERAYHAEGPGQNVIKLRFSDPLTAADNALTFRAVARSIAQCNGLAADFSPMPLENYPGNGFYINISIASTQNSQKMCYLVAGILERIGSMTAFLNPTENSYTRFGQAKALKSVSWSNENCSQMIRIPTITGTNHRTELLSPDPTANPYLAFALVLKAGLHGISHTNELPMGADFNLYKAMPQALAQYRPLPENLQAAKETARNSQFIQESLPKEIIESYCGLC